MKVFKKPEEERTYYPFCGFCGGQMGSVNITEQDGYDRNTGEKLYKTKYGWACTELNYIDYYVSFHDGWLDIL